LSFVRALLYGAGAIALLATFSPDSVRSALAACSGALFEATPFLVAGFLLSHVLPRYRAAADFLGCGCGFGPSARSLPAAVASWLVFGPAVTIARFTAALLAARWLSARGARGCEEGASLLGELGAVFPSAAIAGVALQWFASFDPARLSPIASATLGVALGFGAAPCALGAVALGGALHVRAPVAAAAFLCIAGIVDARALARKSSSRGDHDALAYALLAAALAVVAARHGDTLVHPAFTIVLAGCSAVALAFAAAYRQSRNAGARFVPALMLAGAFVGAPVPQYRATETTLTELFAGERLSFTGTLVRDGGTAALVRYAITCCRADASPVAVRLGALPSYPPGTWLRVDGRVANVRGDLRLLPERIRTVSAPTDPFIYR
jgi:hypothetical protein